MPLFNPQPPLPQNGKWGLFCSFLLRWRRRNRTREDSFFTTTHSFLFVAKEEKKQKRKQKTSWLGGRLWHSLNTPCNSLSLRQHSVLCSGNPTSSKDLLVRNVFIGPLPIPPEGGRFYANAMSIKQPSLAP